MSETKPDSFPIGSTSTPALIQESGSEESLGRLSAEGLTTLQQLKRSGQLLIQSMELSLEAENTEAGFNPQPLVEAAKALAGTAQVQANLVKVLKEFAPKETKQRRALKKIAEGQWDTADEVFSISKEALE